MSSPASPKSAPNSDAFKKTRYFIEPEILKTDAQSAVISSGCQQEPAHVLMSQFYCQERTDSRLETAVFRRDVDGGDMLLVFVEV